MSYIPLAASGSEIGAAAGTAVAPGIGTVIGSFVGGLFHGGGPSISSHTQRTLAAGENTPTQRNLVWQAWHGLTRGTNNPSIAQSNPDPNWQQVWGELAAAGSPAITATMNEIVNANPPLQGGMSFVPPSAGTFATGLPPGGSGTGSMTAGVLGGTNLTTLALVGGGALLISQLAGGRRRARR